MIEAVGISSNGEQVRLVHPAEEEGLRRPTEIADVVPAGQLQLGQEEVGAWRGDGR